MRQFQTLLRPTLVVLATLFAGSCGDNANRVSPLAPSPLDSAAPVLRDTIPGTVNRAGAATLSKDDTSKDDTSKDDKSKDDDSKDDNSKDDNSKDDDSKDDKSKDDKSKDDKSKDDKSKNDKSDKSKDDKSTCTSKTPQGIVECRRSQYGHMSSSQIVAFLRGVAKDLNAAGIGGGPFGILRKSGGYNCGGYSCDIICSGQGNAQQQWDVLSDAEGAQKPVWNGPKTWPNIRVDACEIQRP